GEGDPAKSLRFKEAIETLYPVSYTLKFMIKKGKSKIDYAVMPLEGLWCADDMSRFNPQNKNLWKWTLMIMQPECVTKELLADAIDELKKKKDLSLVPEVRFENFCDGLSAQIMYVGPYANEGQTIKKIHDFIRNKGHELRGRHHEIYLSDPRRAKPEKLKTIIRQPIK
ncbi:MAG: GyrI-like domain-containing protein, partial [Candidatus Omnitrophota bacterium]